MSSIYSVTQLANKSLNISKQQQQTKLKNYHKNKLF